METLMHPAIPLPLRFPHLSTNLKFIRLQLPSTICCSRKNGKIDGASSSPSPKQSEGHENAEISQEGQLKSAETETKDNAIWRLFKEAQQNILYLNKQRLVALEELNKTNQEKQLLLDRIEQLEAEEQIDGVKDNVSLFWELLLRIDSLVLTRMISNLEASDLRRLVMDRKVSIADVFSNVQQKSDAELLAEFRHFSEGAKKNGFHIVHICTEMEPLVSVSPLSSYVTGLSCALQRKGHSVEVILPKYPNLDLHEVEGLREIEAESYSYFNGQLHGNKIWTGVVYGIGVTLIEPMVYSSFFSREKLYGYADDFERFTYFSRASLDYIVKCGKQPDVLHIHNWQTAVVGPLFWDIFVKQVQGLEGTRILFTCHDLESQCVGQPDKLALCGLDPGRLNRPDRLQDDSKTHLVNILKGGIVYSNKVVIMSSMHSKGRVVRSMGHGLEPTFTTHKDKMHVAPYGFEQSTWDPSTDKFLPENYSAEDMNEKAVCKVALQQRLGLPQQSSAILVGCIFPEVSVLDLENLNAAVRNTTKSGAQFFFMGDSVTPSITRSLESFQEELEGENVKFLYTYDEDLSHLMYAASDLILCQSFHDPLFQVPLKALKYGAAPIPITTTEKNFRYSVDHDHEITTFSDFIGSTIGVMSLTQALDEIINNPSGWKRKMMDAMAKDFSWDGECCDIHVSAYADIKSL